MLQGETAFGGFVSIRRLLIKNGQPDLLSFRVAIDSLTRTWRAGISPAEADKSGVRGSVWSQLVDQDGRNTVSLSLLESSATPA